LIGQGGFTDRASVTGGAGLGFGQVASSELNITADPEQRMYVPIWRLVMLEASSVERG
jgi:hypothetical protein